MSKEEVKTAMAAQTDKQQGKKVMTKNDELKLFFQQRLPDFRAALPRTGFTPERLLRILFNCFNQNPVLLECSKQSLFACVMQAAQLGIEPGGPLAHAHLIPFRVKGQMTCTMIIGYQGMIELAYRSGKLASINAGVVRKGDIFEYEKGLNEKLRHVPGEKRGELTHAYAYFKTQTGSNSWVVLTKEDIEKHRAMSKMPDGPAWKDNYESMALKTALRELFKFMPKSAEIQKAIALENAMDSGMPIEDIPITTESEVVSTIEEHEEILVGKIDRPDSLDYLSAISICKSQGECASIIENIENSKELTPEQKTGFIKMANKKAIEFPDV